MAEDIVALLPLKAHSERIPGKNFRELAGKPLVRWILDTLIELPEISAVVINTDAVQHLEELGVTNLPKVQIRQRAASLCGDMVSMNRIIEDDLNATDAVDYLMTHTTNPLLSAGTVRAAIERYRGSARADSLFTVNRQQTRFYREDGSAVNHDPDNLIRTQDLEPWFEENSCLYLFSKASFAATGARIGAHPVMFETPPLESVDIDEGDDWYMAEALLEKRNREAGVR